jgi:streptogrisin C
MSLRVTRSPLVLRLALTALVLALVAALAPAATAAPAPAGWAPEAVAAAARDLGLPPGRAAEKLAAQGRAAALAADLTAALGDRAAGTYLDGADRLVVAVTDEAAAAEARAAGATATVVPHSLAHLEQAAAAVGDAAPVGVAVAPDVTTNGLVVEVPEGTDASASVAAAQATGVPVAVRTVPEAVRTYAYYGGEALLLGGGGRCSAGFISQARSGNQYVITAGHCNSGGTARDESGAAIGAFAAASFPGNDYAAVRINDPFALGSQGAVATQGIIYGQGAGESGIVDITSAGRVPVGSTVCRAGSTTGYFCGTVQGYNSTVRYAEGSVSGLTRTTVCAEPGDSGGALIAGSQAQGVTSGGSGNCSSGGTTYFQPVDEILSTYGLSLL